MSIHSSLPDAMTVLKFQLQVRSKQTFGQDILWIDVLPGEDVNECAKSAADSYGAEVVDICYEDGSPFGIRTIIDRSDTNLFNETSHNASVSILEGIATNECGETVDLLKIQALCYSQFKASGNTELLQAVESLSVLTGYAQTANNEWIKTPGDSPEKSRNRQRETN